MKIYAVKIIILLTYLCTNISLNPIYIYAESIKPFQVPVSEHGQGSLKPVYCLFKKICNYELYIINSPNIYEILWSRHKDEYYISLASNCSVYKIAKILPKQSH